MSVKEERGRIWEAVNNAFLDLNLVKAETALDTLEVMIQGEDEAEKELKAFNKDLTDKRNAAYKEISKKIEGWNMDEAEAGNFFGFKDGLIKTAEVKARRKNMYALAKKHDLFHLGE